MTIATVFSTTENMTLKTVIAKREYTPYGYGTKLEYWAGDSWVKDHEYAINIDSEAKAIEWANKIFAESITAGYDYIVQVMTKDLPGDKQVI